MDEHQLETGLAAAKNRFAVAAVSAACAALLGIVGLATPGIGQILGLLALIACGILVSYALRQRAKREHYASQLDELNGSDAG